MDSYEKIRRMNELSKELRVRGFAESSVEAIRQAQEIYGSEDSTDLINKNTTDPEQTNQFTEKAPQRMEYEQLSHMLKSNEQFKKGVQDNVTALAADVAACIDKVNEIVKKINEIETKISGIKGMTLSQGEPRQQQQPERQERPEMQEPARPAQPEQKPATDKPADGSYNQRNGNFTETDVSIEKMFYMGRK